jgi:hypothetical protein
MTTVLALPPTPNLPGFTDVDARNPAELGFPPMLPYELAMKVDSPANICRAYGMSRDQFRDLIAHPVFIKAYQEAIEALKIDGMGFKVKARMQAEAYLDTAFHMAQNPGTSDSVRADIIKNTVRWAGFDAKAAEVGQGNSFNIQINLG